MHRLNLRFLKEIFLELQTFQHETTLQAMRRFELRREPSKIVELASVLVSDEEVAPFLPDGIELSGPTSPVTLHRRIRHRRKRQEVAERLQLFALINERRSSNAIGRNYIMVLLLLLSALT